MLPIFEKKVLTLASQTAVILALAGLPISLSAASPADPINTSSKLQHFAVPAQALD
ncbi:hypothetical protein [Thiopseudomonas alkaliphila]|uniref:hypothetical protein n=1 Tax=Thiopseudomonas alkaliphila TaxID=1697053 RepID=UPI0025774FCB|nr:hypothetical protein [Thiopseudomonas alkaliphila]MDM1706884.1 hypothetical protein [Thiopseudomonas alkaliphila]